MNIKQLQTWKYEHIEVTVTLATKALELAERTGMACPEREKLAHLLRRAVSLMNEIRIPYLRNPVLPDASYHPKDSDDKLPVPK